MRIKSRGLIRIASAVAVGVLGVSACSSSAGKGGGPLTIIIPASPGGNLDTNVRQLQAPLQKALGETIVVQNNAVGSGVGAANQLLQKGGDCSQIAANNIPALLYNIKNSPGNFKSSQFAALANILTDYGEIRVQKNAKWKTFADFLSDAKANPGKISISVASTVVSNYQGMLDLEKAAGVKFNLVPFTGGGPARTALLGGKVDATATNIFESLNLASKTRVLAVQQPTNKYPEQTDNAPTMSSVVGTTVPSSSTLYGFFASNDCKTKNPDRFQAIENAIATASKDSSFIGSKQKLGNAGSVDYLNADQYRQAIAPIAQELGVDPLS